MEPTRTIPQRELRNNVAAVLREVEGGGRVRVTVHGHAVADLVPIARRRTFVPGAEALRIIREAPLDADFESDVDSVVGELIEDVSDPWE